MLLTVYLFVAGIEFVDDVVVGVGIGVALLAFLLIVA